ncbi:MAG: hypothetical protein RI906_1006 [Pseudomonadota bacterium]
MEEYSKPVASGDDTHVRRLHRRKVFSALVFGGILVTCGSYTRVAAAASGPVLVLGDSLSAEYGIARGKGWVSLLQARLAHRSPSLSVINASVSGETTAGGRTRIAALLERHKPSVVVIELGGNDALRGLDLKRTEANLREMIVASRSAGARPLLVGMQVPPNYGRSYTQAFAALFDEVARSTGTPLVPFLLAGIAEDLAFFQDDQIHPNERAQPLMLDTVWPSLKTLLP